MITILSNDPNGVLVQYGHGLKAIISIEQAEQYAREGQVIADLR